MKKVVKEFVMSWDLKGATEAIEREPSIPRDIKQIAKDYLEEKFDEISQHTGELIDFPVIDILQEWWPIIVELISNLR